MAFSDFSFLQAEHDLGQCIAAMVAARISNEMTGEHSGPVYAVVSTGAAWRFLRMEGNELRLDRPEYFIDNLPKIMGILKLMVDSA